MSESSLSFLSLAFLVPAGYALIAAAGLPTERARHAAVGTFAALGLAVLGYLAIGFALQFGGVGLVHDAPGYDGLIWEWSALGPTWGPGWGMAGLAGWAMGGAAATPAARTLALTNLPWVATAVLIPIITLRGRAPTWAAGLLGLLSGAFFYPLAGNWIWGGGWLANIAGNLGFGHGFVDAAGAGLVHLLGASIALAGLVVFLPRRPRFVPAEEPTPLPRVYLPLLCLLGCVSLLIGSLSWATANPLVSGKAVEPERILLNTVLSAAVGGLMPLVYTWLVARRPDPLMAARGMGCAVAAVMAIAPFVAPWASALIGALAGVLTPFGVYLFDRILRLEESTASLTVHGLGALLGLAALGILADGTAGAGWNGVGAGQYAGNVGQGVSGLLVVAGLQRDFPGQLQAQLIGIAGLALFGFFAAWLAVAPLATVAHLLAPKPAAIPEANSPLAVPAEPSTSGGVLAATGASFESNKVSESEVEAAGLAPT